MLTNKLKKADEFLYELGKKLNLLSLITPINLMEEKEKFFANLKYNPKFTYNIDLRTLEKIEKDLSTIEIDTKFWQGFLLNQVKEKYENDCMLIKQIGSDVEEFMNLNQEKYISKLDLADQEILLKAGEELNEDKPLNPGTSYDAQKVLAIFNSFLKLNEIDWSVVIDKNLVPLLSVNYFQKQIRINPLINLTQIELERMLIHEIETHIYRYLNGKNLFKTASIGLKNYEKTAEGLAAYNESLLFPQDKKFLRRFYFRYKAILFGENNSFRKLYEYLRDELEFGKEESWRTAVRVKRGISDTSTAGAFLKDRIYLQGYFSVRELTFSERKNLYKGKFSLEHLKSKKLNLDDDTMIPIPEYLPSIYSKLNEKK